MFLSINGDPVDSIDTLITLIDTNLGQPTQVTVQRNGEVISVTLTPRLRPPEGEGPMGVGLKNPTQPITRIQALNRGVIASYENVRGLLMLPVRLLSGQARPEEGRLVGYKGMYDIYQEIRNPLWFFMVISLSLGVMNLLPLPAIDGGRILLTLPEIIFRRRIPPQYENAIHVIGFAILILLLLYINIQDFINPIQLP
jgi:regulator of sigma E protease